MSNQFLVEQHGAESARLRTFSLATSVSAIGFAMFQSADRHWHWSLLITFLAVALWAFSIFAAIRFSHKMLEGITLNSKINDGKKNGIANDVLTKVQNELDKTQKCMIAWQSSHLYSLLAGAIVYFAGHIAKILYDVQPCLTQ